MKFLQRYERDILRLSAYLKQTRKWTRQSRSSRELRLFIRSRTYQTLMKNHLAPIMCTLNQTPRSVNRSRKPGKCSRFVSSSRRLAERTCKRIQNRDQQMQTEYQLLRELRAVFKDLLHLVNNADFRFANRRQVGVTQQLLSTVS